MTIKVELEKVTLRLRSGDADFLQALYPAVGHNKVIRALVSNFVNTQRERLNVADSAHPPLTLNEGDLDV